MRTKLSKSWLSRPSPSNSRAPIQGGPYAPPPGPPPQWNGQWETALPQVHSYSRPNTVSGRRGQSSNTVKIASREEEFRRLFKACEAGKGNARLLREAIVYAKPQDLKNNELIEEFLGKCRASQELVCSTIPWATAELDHSQGSRTAGSEEEQLLAQLLAANQELLDVLKMHEDLLRTGTEQEERDRQKAEHKLRALDAITTFEPTPAESALVDQIFAVGDPSGGGTINAHAAYKLFTGSRLPPNVLISIWEIANVEENEMFGRHCVGVALRLVGHAQQGKAVTERLVTMAGPLASLDGFDTSRREASYNTPSSFNDSYSGPSQSGPASANSSTASSPNILPPLTAADRTKFVNIFYNSGPENGVLSAQRARDVLLKSKLPLSTLGEIWELTDTQRRGALDAPAFCVAMYLVQGCMSGQIASVPPTLPPFLYAEAAQAAPGFAPPLTTSPSMSMPQASQAAWTVSAELKASADAFFEVLDERRTGYVDGETARSHFTESGLPPDAFAQVWRLADVDADGRLSKDEFAVALYLIQSRESGEELPQVLPASLVPPSSRRGSSSGSGSGSQTPQFPQPSVRDEELLIDFEGPEEPVRMPLPTINTRTPPRTSPSMSPLAPRTPTTPSSASFGGAPPPLPSRTPSAAPPLPSRTPSMRPASTSPTFASAVPPVTSTEWTWEISAADRASADKFFDQLDPWKQGNIEGEAAVAFLSRSKLPPDVLAKIWDLADRDGDGRLDKSEFVVVMFLVRGRLAGQGLPESVPPALFEPVAVETSSAGTASAQQSVVATPEMMASVPIVEEQARSDEPPPPYQENIPAET